MAAHRLSTRPGRARRRLVVNVCRHKPFALYAVCTLAAMVWVIVKVATVL